LVLIAWGIVSGFGGVVYNVNSRSLMQAVTPDRLLGRVIATNRFIVWGVIPLGSFLGGVLGTALGLRPTLWLAAIGDSLGFVPPLLSRLRGLRQIPEPLEQGAGSPPCTGVGPASARDRRLRLPPGRTLGR
jgi:hypothetical protein